MTYQQIYSTPEFKKLHPVKQQIIKELMQNGKSTSPETMLPKLLSINKELSKRNLSFTKDESNLLISIMKENMSPEEQQKVDMLLGMFYH